jgi:hypothetical protein
MYDNIIMIYISHSLAIGNSTVFCPIYNDGNNIDG